MLVVVDWLRRHTKLLDHDHVELADKIAEGGADRARHLEF
jgi:hypothetical protein